LFIKNVESDSPQSETHVWKLYIWTWFCTMTCSLGLHILLDKTKNI